MKSKMKLSIISLEGEKFERIVNTVYVTLPSIGREGILPNRIPLISPLDDEEIYYYVGEEKHFLKITNGIVMYQDSVVDIICDHFELINEEK